MRCDILKMREVGNIQFSYSRVDTYRQCPRKFRYRYVDFLKTYDDPAPDSPLICGNAVHHGIEMGEDAGIEWYYKQFYGINDKHVNEEIKLRYSIEQMRQEVDYERAQFEFELNTPDFKGFIDCMEYVDETNVDLLDFKYANPKNTWRYEQSGQLHVYAKKLLDHCGITVRNMAYLVMPKTMIRQKKTESIMQFRRRLQNELEQLHPIRLPIEYSPEKVFEFDSYCNQIVTAREYPKQESKLCDWCDLQEYCESEGEIDYMILPENKRVAVDTSQPPVIWLYGQPFSGKTTFANQAPDVIHLNTDGNVKYVDGARIIIREEVTMEGRLKKIKYAWENFIEAVDLLIAGQHEFKNVTVDLVEDVFEMCRVYMYNKLGIDHEQDAGFGKGYDMVRTQFLPQIRRLTAAGLGVILISHENVSEIIKKNGEKITNIYPNIQSKYANKIAGMVDIVGRVVIDDDDSRWITFKTDNTQFGGGRLVFDESKVPLNYESFMSTYRTAKPSGTIQREVTPTAPTQPEPTKDAETTTDSEPTSRRRARRTE